MSDDYQTADDQIAHLRAALATKDARIALLETPGSLVLSPEEVAKVREAFHHIAHCVECGETSYEHCSEGSPLAAEALAILGRK